MWPFVLFHGLYFHVVQMKSTIFHMVTDEDVTGSRVNLHLLAHFQALHQLAAESVLYSGF